MQLNTLGLTCALAAKKKVEFLSVIISGSCIEQECRQGQAVSIVVSWIVLNPKPKAEQTSAAKIRILLLDRAISLERDQSQTIAEERAEEAMPNLATKRQPQKESWKTITDAVHNFTTSSDSSAASSDSPTDSSKASSESESAKGRASSSDSDDSHPGSPPSGTADGEVSRPGSPPKATMAEGPASVVEVAEAMMGLAPPLNPPADECWNQSTQAATASGAFPQPYQPSLPTFRYQPDCFPPPAYNSAGMPFYSPLVPGYLPAFTAYRPQALTYEPTAWEPLVASPQQRPTHPEYMPPMPQYPDANGFPAACTCAVCAPSLQPDMPSLPVQQPNSEDVEREVSQPASSRQHVREPSSPAYTPTFPQHEPSSPSYHPDSAEEEHSQPGAHRSYWPGASTEYEPISPAYEPNSPPYEPTSPRYAPTSPAYTGLPGTPWSAAPDCELYPTRGRSLSRYSPLSPVPRTTSQPCSPISAAHRQERKGISQVLPIFTAADLPDRYPDYTSALCTRATVLH